MTSTYRTRRRTAAFSYRQSRNSRGRTARRRGNAASRRRDAAEAAREQAARLAAALQALARGLPNPWDESDDYFHGFTAELLRDADLDPDSFRAALAIGARYEIDLSPAGQMLTELAEAVDELGERIAGGFRQLATVMHATLGDLSLAFARGKGVVRVRVWLFGRTEEGTLVGLRSIGTET
jgi:hypothetical protein